MSSLTPTDGFLRVQLSGPDAWLSACKQCRKVLVIGPFKSLTPAENGHKCEPFSPDIAAD